MKNLLIFIPLLAIFSCGENPPDPNLDVCSKINNPKVHTITIPRGAIYQTSGAYRPSTLIVEQCDLVIWENQDVVWHTATADKANDAYFNTSQIDPKKKSRPILFKKLGEVPYHCAPHPKMKGKITVKKRP